MMIDRQIDAEPTQAAPGTANAAQRVRHDADHGFDDGLVHDHGWACRERGAPQSRHAASMRS
jgi:hypothetical protein